MNRKSILLSLICIAVLIGCGTGSSVKKAGIASDFTLSAIDGGQISLSSLKGNVVLVDFWATWCPPCQSSIPVLVGLYNKYHERGFVVLGISTSDSEDILKPFVREHNIPYPILLGSNDVAREYGVTGIPHMVIIDQKGKIVKTQVGYSNQLDALFDKIIDSLLTE